MTTYMAMKRSMGGDIAKERTTKKGRKLSSHFPTIYYPFEGTVCFLFN